MSLRAKKEMTQDQKKIIDKWLLIMLAVDNYKPIRGRIRLVKEFFLIWQKFFKDLGNIAEFYPYHFGPYSTLLAVRVNELFIEKIINFAESGQDILYGLTNKGKKKGAELIRYENPNIINEIDTLKKRYAKMSTGKILGEIYRKYPQFAEYSLISEESSISGKFPILLTQSELVDDSSGFIKPTEVDEDFVVSKKYREQFIEKIVK